MNVRKRWVSLAGSCLLLALSAVSAKAQGGIGFLPSSSQNVTFMATSGTSMNIALGSCSASYTGTCTLSGSAASAGDTGTYIFSTTTGANPITLMNTGGTVFPAHENGATITFTYTGSDGDKLTGTFVLNDAANGSSNPHLDGFIATGYTVSGDSAFTSQFSTSTLAIDVLLGSLNCSPSLSPCTMENLFSNPGTTGSAPVSSGEITNTPEPGSMFLFGSGVLVLGTFLRRQLHA